MERFKIEDEGCKELGPSHLGGDVLCSAEDERVTLTIEAGQFPHQQSNQVDIISCTGNVHGREEAAQGAEDR